MDCKKKKKGIYMSSRRNKLIYIIVLQSLMYSSDLHYTACKHTVYIPSKKGCHAICFEEVIKAVLFSEEHMPERLRGENCS